ncbi:MAG: hypothetical protein IKQ28_08315, partial [Lachnospiraceae bacterium]|nr:hypothetical protein [Lachnospiraceae bacterium]
MPIIISNMNRLRISKKIIVRPGVCLAAGLLCLSLAGCSKDADKAAEVQDLGTSHADLTDGITKKDTEISSEEQETGSE